jgi:hypothetical protein
VLTRLPAPRKAHSCPARARGAIADQVMAAIARLSGQEYVHTYASARKAELAERS